MKKIRNKKQINLLVMALIFLSVFFVKTNKVSAVTCISSLGTCKYVCDPGSEGNIGNLDCETGQACCIATPAITASTCPNAYPGLGYSCVDSTGRTGCVQFLCLGGNNIQCCPPVAGAGAAGADATSVNCGTGFDKIGGVCFPTNTGLSNASITTILENLFSWLMGLFTTLAVMAFVVSGVQYLVAAGNEDIMETAKRNMTFAMIGVVVGLSGFVIVRAIAAALSGTSIFF